MPMVAWQDFRGGLWLPSDADADARQAEWTIPDNALTEAVNVEFLDGGGVRGRRGYELFDAAELPHPVFGIYKHYPRTGPRTSGYSSCSSANSGSGTSWTNTGLSTALPDEDEVAECILTNAGDSSKYLLCANPYAAPYEVADAPVSGLVLEVRRRATPAGGIGDLKVQLQVGGSLAGVSKDLRGVAWPTDWATIYYGGPGDTWGIDGLTAAQINAPDFGIVFQVEALATLQAAQVDYIALHTYVDLELAATTILAVGDASNAPSYYRPADGGSGYTLMTSGALATAYRPRFVPWQELDATFVFDGKNAVKRFDGRSWVTGPAAAPVGPYAALWRGRMWATAPSELAFSVYASNVGDVETWNPALQLGVSDPRGGTITGIEALGDRLIVLKDSGLWAFTGDIEFGGFLEQISEVGCVAPASVCVLPEGIVYVAEDGVYLLPRTGNEPIELSRPIRPRFRGRSSGEAYREAVAVYLRPRRQVWVKLQAADVSVLVGQAVRDAEGNVGTAWAEYDEAGGAIDMTAAATLDGVGDDGILLLGQSDGIVRRWDTGIEDGGSEIAARIRTAARQFSGEMAQGAIRRVQAACRLRADPSVAKTVTFGVRYDNAVTDAAAVQVAVQNTEPSEIRHPRATFTDQSKLGRFGCVSVEFEGGAEAEVHMLQADVSMRTRRQWRA